MHFVLWINRNHPFNFEDFLGTPDSKTKLMGRQCHVWFQRKILGVITGLKSYSLMLSEIIQICSLL